MPQLIKKVKEFSVKILDLFFTFFLISWGTLVVGTGLYLGIMFAYYGLYWVLGGMCFFLIFHLGDLRDFFKERNFIAIIGRLLCLYGLTSFIAGFIAYASGAYRIKESLFSEIALIFSIALSLLTVIIAVITYRYLWHSSVPKFFRNILDKLYESGIFWRY
jgi:hypothetical protein